LHDSERFEVLIIEVRVPIEFPLMLSMMLLLLILQHCSKTFWTSFNSSEVP